MSWIEQSEKETKQKGSANFDDFFIKQESSDSIVVLLFGDSGSGKTYTAMTFPEPIYYIDTETKADITKKVHFADKDIKIFWPSEFKTDFDPKTEDAIDEHKTINRITEFVLELAKKAKSGDIKGGTVVLDSCTDVWSWCQEWGAYYLADMVNKDGSRKANVITLKLNNQLDWGIINRRHKEIIFGLRSLRKYGINIVFTAREQTIPEYVAKTGISTLKDKIRAQKDVYFDANTIFNLKRQNTVNGTKFVALCERIDSKIPPQTTENLSYDKIKEMLKK